MKHGSGSVGRSGGLQESSTAQWVGPSIEPHRVSSTTSPRPCCATPWDIGGRSSPCRRPFRAIRRNTRLRRSFPGHTLRLVTVTYWVTYRRQSTDSGRVVPSCQTSSQPIRRPALSLSFGAQGASAAPAPSVCDGLPPHVRRARDDHSSQQPNPSNKPRSAA